MPTAGKSERALEITREEKSDGGKLVQRIATAIRPAIGDDFRLAGLFFDAKEPDLRVRFA